ncbi:MAG: DUF2284 domain-containing protein [Candidatus Aminicenantes bacterium]|nr:DUF2284 domain-containing protein [Candidatus Aminicenantes bacterium]
MERKENLEKIFYKYGFTDFKWIDPKKIVVAHWVRMKCLFGCREFGKSACCPPNVPSVEECEKFFKEYSKAVVFHCQKKVSKPKDRFAWTRQVNRTLLDVEREVFISGFEKTFLLFLDSCNICGECTAGRKEDCREPEQARTTPEALAMDVYSTVRQVGYDIQVLSDYSQKMNRFAFLLIE